MHIWYVLYVITIKLVITALTPSYPHSILTSSLHPHTNPHSTLTLSHPHSTLTPSHILTPFSSSLHPHTLPHFKFSSSFSVNRYNLMSSFPFKQPQICWNKDWSTLLPVPPLQETHKNHHLPTTYIRISEDRCAQYLMNI